MEAEGTAEAREASRAPPGYKHRQEGQHWKVGMEGGGGSQDTEERLNDAHGA